MTDILPRLYSVLDQLPVIGLPPRLLNVGCGDFPCAPTLAAALPGWMVVGVDRDGAALRRAAAHNGPPRGSTPHLVQGDARDLTALLRAQFGVILVRHPDIFHSRATWTIALPGLVHLLVPGGILVISLYAPEETEMVRALALPPPLALDESVLPGVDLAGRDRFVWAVRR